VGCASVGRQVDQGAVDKIEKGKTTRAEVISLIGSPDRIMNIGTGDTIFSYHYARAAAKPQSFIPIVGPFIGGTNVQSQYISIMFGPDDVVKNITSSHSSSEFDRGAATSSKATLPDVEDNKRPK
jgi:outer membrane protein assembly factor BamE (lipoprotein component of BamABCDE complex)